MSVVWANGEEVNVEFFVRDSTGRVCAVMGEGEVVVSAPLAVRGGAEGGDRSRWVDWAIGRKRVLK